MADKQKMLGMLGLAKKAGKIISGASLVIGEIRSGRAKLVILSSDCSDNTRKKVSDKCEFYNIKSANADVTSYELAKAIGKDNDISAVCLCDAGFVSAIEKILSTEERKPTDVGVE